MSLLLGKKVLIVVPSIKSDGQIDEKKNEEFSGIVLDKFLNSWQNPQFPQNSISCDNFIVEKENGDVETVHPSFIVKIIK